MQHQDGLRDDPGPVGAASGGQAAEAPAEENALTRDLKRDPEIAAALDGGDGKALWDLLSRKRKETSDPLLKAAIERARSQPRNFLMPLSGGAPMMSSINGVGTTLYGKSSPESDGTYIATLFFIFVFVPVFPIGQYLVREAGGNSYTFFGKVPLSDTMRTWRKALLVIAALIGASIAWTALGGVTRNTVHFVSGLDQAVDVSLDGTKFSVPANGRVERKVWSGRHHVEVLGADGRAVDTDEIKVPGGADVVAYNVFGSATLFAEQVIYRSSKAAVGKGDGDGEFTFHGGEHLVVRDTVEYAFVEPPHTRSTSSHAGTTYLWRMDVLPGGWKRTVNAMDVRGDAKGAARLARSVVEVEPGSREARGYALALTRKGDGADEALKLARDWVEAAPDDVEAQRGLQDAMVAAGQHDALLDEARARHQREPSSKLAAYLLARVESPARAEPIFAKLTHDYPDDARVHGNYAWTLHQLRRFEDSAREVRAWEKLGGSRTHFIGVQAENLAALGRIEEAATLVAAAADGETDNPPLFRLYARVAKRAGAAAPHPADYYFIQRDKSLGAEARLLYAVVVGELPLEDDKFPASVGESSRTAMKIGQLVGTDVERALAMLRAATPDALSEVPRIAAILLAGELLRVGDRALGEKVIDAALSDEADPFLIRSAIEQGEAAPRLDELELEQQAAIRFIASRSAKSPAERARLLEQARKDDPLHGPVTWAIDHWR